MRLDQAVQQLDDGMIRKFVIDTKTNTLHVYENPFPDEADTHYNLAVRQKLDPTDARGGRLKVVEKKLKFEGGSTTIYTANASDVEKFLGDVEIF